MLEENKRKLDAISRLQDIKPLLFPIILIFLAVALYYLTRTYSVESNSTFTSGVVTNRAAIIGKSNDKSICEVKLKSGETIRPTCYKFRQIGEVVKVEIQKQKGLIFNTTNYYIDF